MDLSRFDSLDHRLGRIVRSQQTRVRGIMQQTVGKVWQKDSCDSRFCDQYIKHFIDPSRLAFFRERCWPDARVKLNLG